jgi:hypothetical protein
LGLISSLVASDLALRKLSGIQPASDGFRADADRLRDLGLSSALAA